MLDHARRFSEFLRDNNMSVTQERMEIVHAAFAVHDHFTADELVAHLGADNSDVSRASVYRTLGLLVRAGMVRQVDFGRGTSHYEHMHQSEHHDHMVCTTCGNVVEFTDDALEAALDRACQEAGFHPTRHSLKVFGRCERCKDNIQTPEE